MNYRDLIQKAREDGVSTERAMWAGVDDVDELLCLIKKEHPEMYWKFMRNQHGSLYGGHYNEAFAEHDVKVLTGKDKDGRPHKGAEWTVDQIEDATKAMKFPVGTTKWDKYVAFNAFKSVVCSVLDNEQTLKAAYSFYFADENWPTSTKIWDYMCCKQEIK